MSMNILSRLALLKISDNVGARFKEAKDSLKDGDLEIANNIETNNRKCMAAKSLLEWAEYQLGIES